MYQVFSQNGRGKGYLICPIIGVSFQLPVHITVVTLTVVFDPFTLNLIALVSQALRKGLSCSLRMTVVGPFLFLHIHVSSVIGSLKDGRGKATEYVT